MRNKPALTTAAGARSTADGAYDRERGVPAARCTRPATITTEIDRVDVARKQARQYGGAQGEIDQIPGEAIGQALDRRTRALCLLHRFDDLLP